MIWWTKIQFVLAITFTSHAIFRAESMDKNLFYAITFKSHAKITTELTQKVLFCNYIYKSHKTRSCHFYGPFIEFSWGNKRLFWPRVWPMYLWITEEWKVSSDCSRLGFLLLCKIVVNYVNIPSQVLGEIFYWHIEAETKWTPIRRRHFQMHFLEWKCANSN